jgi:hypothetical protein
MSLQALAMHTLNVDDYVRKNKKAITLPADWHTLNFLSLG